MYTPVSDEFIAVLMSYRHDPIFQLKLINLRIQSLTEMSIVSFSEDDKKEHLDDIQKINDVYAKIYERALDLRQVSSYYDSK